MNYAIPTLPLATDIETKPILKKLASSHQALAELKGVSGIIPNQSILVSTLSLQEAQDSSAIENIVTTHDELYRSDVSARQFTTLSSKEVYSYAAALQTGYQNVRTTKLLTNNHILEIQQTLEENSAGFRKIPGTVLKSEQTGEVVYTPPQDGNEVRRLMNNLEQFINEDNLSTVDPLVKMAIIHHQFESIHPFYDGNGRTGRIINILYLVKSGLLDTPILYLSRYINRHKGEYYRLLQSVRDTHIWDPWIMFMLEGVQQTAYKTTQLLHHMRDLMQSHKHSMRTQLPKVYSHDLLNNVFRHPYTKVDFVISDLEVTRITATKYLDELSRIGLLSKHKRGKENYYINDSLVALLINGG